MCAGVENYSQQTQVKMETAMKLKKIKIISISLAAALFLSLLTGNDGTGSTGSKNLAPVSAEASLFNETSVDTKIGKRNLSTDKLIPMGTTFGIKLYSDGAIVTGLQDVLTENGLCCPAADAGIMVGDYIIAVNGRKISKNIDFKTALVTDTTGILKITLKREGEEITVFLEPARDSSGKKCGMWIRDSAAGIGTFTFCDPETGYFGGLGHGICDVDTKAIIDLKEGRPAEITISALEKGKEREPGRLFGYFTEDVTGENGDMGIITANDDTGIFGYLEDIPSSAALPVGRKDELHTGKAEILSTLNNKGPEKFNIRIDEVCSHDGSTKNFIFTVTDKKLLNLTGGIIQGMSGSPIVQNGKLVGAVTHVLVNDPTRGYGIFIENMLEAAK